MRIAYIVDVLDTGQAGTENQLIKMITGLAARGHEIHLVCLRNHPWLESHGGALPCAISVFPAQLFKRFDSYRNIARMVGFLRKLQPDVAHTFFPVANIVGVVAARLAGCGCVLSSRRDYGEWMNRRYLLATRLANRFASGVVANSDPVKDLAVSAEGVHPEKVQVIHNGIDLAPFETLTPDIELKHRLGIASGNKVIVKIANFRPMKRHRCLLEAAALVARSRADVDFLLVGEDAGQTGLRKELEALARALGIGQRVHFAGRQPNVLPYLSHC